MAAVALDRREVLSFRFAGHGLSARRPRSQVVDAVGVIGLRRTKATPVSLAARVNKGGAKDLVQALEDGRLVAVYGARGAVMVVPAADVATFTVGTAPSDEDSLRATIPGAFLRRLERAGVTASDALSQVIDAIRSALADGPLARGELAMTVTRTLPETLTPPCRGRCPDPHVEDSLFRLAGVNGVMAFVKDADVLTGLSGIGTPEDARSELVRRYLTCYGPSQPKALAEWAGIGLADARRSLEALAEETVDATLDGAKAGVMLRADAERAHKPGRESVRFLPAFDPYLLDRDRATLVPDRALQRMVWRASGNPGVIVVAGEPIATWTTRQAKSGLTLRIEPLGPPLPVAAADLEKEASVVAAALGKDASVELAT